MNGFSIIICCYNSASRLPETLRYIAKQQFNLGIGLEVIVVNNNSSDDTSAVAEAVWQSLEPSFPLIVVDEPTPGLSSARDKGIATSTYDHIIFCDDDNLFSENYVAEIYNIFSQSVDIGVIGTPSEPVYLQPAPQWFIEHEFFFAIGTQNDKAADITDSRGFVWGAGVALSKEALNTLNNTGYKKLLSGRMGNKMTTGEDVELCFCLKALGYRIFYTDSCSLKHVMPADRFKIDKFYQLSFQNGYSNILLDTVYKKAMPAKLAIVKKIIRTYVSFFPYKYAVARLFTGKTFTAEKNYQNTIGSIKGNRYLLQNYAMLSENLSKLSGN